MPYKGHAFAQNSKRKKRKLLRLAERDKWICHICQRSVDKELFGAENHPQAPSGDHVIRRADGGSSSFDNMALAHRKCNSEREDNRLPATQPIDEEKRLQKNLERKRLRLRKAETMGDREHYIRKLRKSVENYEKKLAKLQMQN